MESNQLVNLVGEIAETVKSGKITLSENDKEVVEITARDKKIDIDAKDKEFIKDMISTATKSQGGGGGFKLGRGGGKGAASTAKDVVDELIREGVTVTLFIEGDKVATIGSGADSKLMSLVLGTKGIEVNSPRKLLELGLSL